MDNGIENTPALAKALVGFQKSAPVIERKQTGQAGTRRYKYADISDILTSLRKPLADNGLAVTQKLLGGADGATICRTILWHESGETTSSDLVIPTGETKAQDRGALFTYYRRYALSAELGISTEEDDDGASVAHIEAVRVPGTSASASPNKPASEKQKSMIAALAHKVGKDNEWIDNVMAKTVSSADASAVIEKLQALEGDTPTERQWK